MARPEPEPAGRYDLPGRESLEKIAAKQPSLLNPLLAYFYFEWTSIFLSSTPYGMDQKARRRIVPDFVRIYGVDYVISLLRHCPHRRQPSEPGGLSLHCWREIS